MIPEIKRQEWKDLITNKINPELSSFSLKMKINSVRLYVSTGKMSLDEAVKDLYALCVKYEKIYADDLDKVFKTKNVTL